MNTIDKRIFMNNLHANIHYQTINKPQVTFIGRDISGTPIFSNLNNIDSADMAFLFSLDRINQYKIKYQRK